MAAKCQAINTIKSTMEEAILLSTQYAVMELRKMINLL